MNKSKIDYNQRIINTTLETYIVDAQTFFDGESPEIEFLVPGCIPKGNIVLITGESGAKKSWIAYELARAVAKGTKWMGRGLVTSEPQRVLILNYDSPTDTLKVRLIKLGFGREDPISIHTQGLSPKMLLLPAELSRLNLIIESLQPTLTIVDSFRQSNTFNENDSQEMAILMGIFKSWTATDSKNTVILLHHTVKSQGDKSWQATARGSGEIISSADVVIRVEPDETTSTLGTLTWTKTRAWEIGETKETTFEVVDEYISDDEHQDLKVLVRATSPLPGELQRTYDERLMNVFYEAKKPLTRNEIYTKSRPIKKPYIDFSMRKALATHKITYKVENKMKYYYIKQ